MSSQDDCRSQVSRSVSGGETARPASESQTSPIAQRFSDCMTKEGWHLATPKSIVAVNNPPTGSPSTNPSAASAVAIPVKNYPSQSSFPANPNPNNTSSYPTAIVTYPPSGAPSVNPSAAAARAPAAVANTIVAQPAQEPTNLQTTIGLPGYEAARPGTVLTPAYGAGPGRQF